MKIPLYYLLFININFDKNIAFSTSQDLFHQYFSIQFQWSKMSFHETLIIF